jgi:hypothetical protein
MPQNEIGWLLLIGAVFFLIGLLGGGVEVSVVKIPPISKYPRVAFSVLGTIFIVLAIFRILVPTNPSSNQPPVPPTSLPPTQIVPVDITATSGPALPPPASPTPPVTTNTFFSDDFETIPGVWELGETSNEYASEKITINNGKYVWEVTSIKPTFRTQLPEAPVVSDFELQAEMRLVSGPEDAAYGLVFRSNNQGLYGLYIMNRGIFMLGFRDGQTGEWSYPVEWTQSQAINENSPNILRVVAKGPGIELFINEKRVGSISDTHLSSGRTGITVSLLEAEQKAIVEVDNFYLTEPQE